MASLLLNDDWDISLDSNGDFTMATDNYAIAQNTACRCRAFTNDMYFNQEDGVPHFSVDISQQPNTSIIAAAMEEVAAGTDGVSEAALSDVTLTTDRTLEAELTLTLDNGDTINLTI